MPEKASRKAVKKEEYEKSKSITNKKSPNSSNGRKSTPKSQVNKKDQKKKKKEKDESKDLKKRDPPGDIYPLRSFYETLHKQVPASKMAAICMIESGLLPKDEAKIVFDRKQKGIRQQKLSSPLKRAASVETKAGEDDTDDEFAVDRKMVKKPRVS